MRTPLRHNLSLEALLTLVCVSVVPSAAADDPRPLSSQPKSPDEAIKSFELPDGFRIELMAAEPLVQDPVAIEWGADGKLWVVEMADYPYGLDGKMSPGGRVRFLEDTDRDGRYDRSTVFLDKINFPTGVLPWRKGVLVTAAPEIFYAEDTDGDGKADVRKPLFQGFAEGNPQLRVNGLQWGLDGWVYCANGWSSGKIRCVLTGDVIDLARQDFRIQPDTGKLELQTGITEFGRNRDDWGNWYGCDNTNVAWHFVLEDRYLRRNPHLKAPDPRKQFLPPSPKVFATSQPQKRYHTFEHVDRYSSGCAATPYRDELLFADDAQHMFICEPGHNLVQHLVLAKQGSTFSATVPEHREGRDFLTSTDPWCRPVNLRTGPDGALWVVDMYRYMIEHPDYLPDIGKRELEPHYRAGENSGRLYRVYHENRPPRAWKPLAAKSAEQLCETLASPNGWQRDVAQQQLMWRGESASEAAIANCKMQIANSESTSAKSRLQSLYTLAGLNALDAQSRVKAIDDPHAMVRRAAVRLSEGRSDGELWDGIVRLASDPSAAVRLQVACTLGESKTGAASEALAKIVDASDDDPYLEAAAFSSLRRDNLSPSLNAAIRRATSEPQRGSPAVELVRLAGLLGREDLVLGMFAELSPSPSGYGAWQIEAAERWHSVQGRRDTNSPDTKRASEATAKAANARLGELAAWARETTVDPQADPAIRAASLRLSMRTAPTREAAAELALSLLAPQTSTDVQRVAVRELAALNNVETGERLLARWKSLVPSIRHDVLAEVLSRPALSELLIERLEQGDIRPGEIDAPSRQRLMTSKSDNVRRRAKLVFGDASADRKSVLAEYREIEKLRADVARGRDVFAQKCSICHVHEGKGHAIGPDLAALSDRSFEGLLTSILDPSRAIEPKYTLYTAITSDGRAYSGILVSETSNQITLVEQENRRHVLLRSELEELTSSEKSLMPDGLEKDLTRQQLADLIAYMRARK
jgi:putative membrane-bound dehydrogenase-like protein